MATLLEMCTYVHVCRELVQCFTSTPSNASQALPQTLHKHSLKRFTSTPSNASQTLPQTLYKHSFKRFTNIQNPSNASQTLPLSLSPLKHDIFATSVIWGKPSRKLPHLTYTISRRAVTRKKKAKRVALP